ncbi:MAG: hypothetical protein ACRYF3_05635 [Janthinobacterium lividum]
MAYFTAVLSSDEPIGDRAGRPTTTGDWRSVDVYLEAASPDDLGNVLRGAVEEAGSLDDAVVLAVLEREDEWFAIVRSDGDVDVRVFVSDAVAAGDSSYAQLFAELPPPSRRKAAVAKSGTSDPDLLAGDEDGSSEPVVASPTALEDVWAGDADLLADLGCSADVLLRLAGSGADPSVATVEIGELLGFADVLESLR